jgi:hypothetical protein
MDTLAGLYRTQPGVTTKVEVPPKESSRSALTELKLKPSNSLREEVVTILDNYQSLRALIRASGTLHQSLLKHTRRRAQREERVVLRHLS